MGNTDHNPSDEGTRDCCILWHAVCVPYEHVISMQKTLCFVFALSNRGGTKITVHSNVTVRGGWQTRVARLSGHAGIA